MFKEHDVVRSKRAVNNEVQEGTHGTIVYIYNSDPIHYEVEFFNEEGESIALLTVDSDAIELRTVEKYRL